MKGRADKGREEEEAPQSVEERYTQWKSLVPVLYDWLANHNLINFQKQPPHLQEVGAKFIHSALSTHYFVGFPMGSIPSKDKTLGVFFPSVLVLVDRVTWYLVLVGGGRDLTVLLMLRPFLADGIASLLVYLCMLITEITDFSPSDGAPSLSKQLTKAASASTFPSRQDDHFVSFNFLELFSVFRQTDGSCPNTLVIANCEIVKPRVAAAQHISQFNEESRSPFVKKFKTIIHPGEVAIRVVPVYIWWTILTTTIRMSDNPYCYLLEK
ncbi:hypothetical protein FXO37_16076 [Capsicum annuum]|nr:hypothetical protein FXO37_16076 [Capsicum annuum]